MIINNEEGKKINPATEEKQDQIIALMGGSTGGKTPAELSAEEIAAMRDGAQKTKLVDANGTTTFPSGKPVVLTGSVTLPANASSYAGNDAVNNSASTPAAISFDVDAALANGGGGIIGLVKIEAPSQFAGKQLNVMVYKEAPTAIPNDNAPFILSSANTAKRIANLPVLMDSAIDSSLICYGQAQFALPYQCLSTAKTLKALLYTSDAVTSPTQSGVITIAVTTIQIA